MKQFFKDSWLGFSLRWSLIVLVILGIVLGLFTFVLANQQIFGASMQPNFNPGDRVFANQLQPVRRGQVVIVKAPDENGQNWYIKRVIGLPGDSVKVVDDTLFVNDRPLPEKYLEAYKQKLKPGDHLTTNFTLKQVTHATKVPKNQYFVLGDNRRVSRDSRNFGFITKDDIRGVVFMKYWPLNDIHFYK